MQIRTHTGLVLMLGLATACTSPGLSYTARLTPDAIDTMAHRKVGVEPFSGPAGGWYAGQFESMLIGTQFDGAAWFTVDSPAQSAMPVSPSAVYSGSIQIIDHDWDERHRTRSKCIEWDGLFDCETRVDVEEICFSESVRVSVTPRLTELANGTVIFSDTYQASASDEDCYETGVYDGAYNRRLKRKRRRHGLNGHLAPIHFSSFSAPADLVHAALKKTLGSVRQDIAPRQTRVKVNFLTAAINPEARADIRFEQALDQSKEDPLGACMLWSGLAETYQNAPAVLYNQAVCAEAAQDFAMAQSLYAKVSALAPDYGEAGEKAHKKTLNRLRDLSDQRYGLQVIDEMTRPQETTEAGS